MKIKKTTAKKQGTPAKKTSKKAGKNDGLLKVSDYNNLAKEYMELSEQIKALDSRKKELSNILKDGAQRLGKEDDRGSSYLPTDDYMVGRVASVSLTKNDEKGYKFLSEYKDKSGKSLSDCIQQVTKYVVDEEAVAEAVKDERISIEEVREGVYDSRTSYRIFVKPMEEMGEEDMPEIQQTSLKRGK